MAALLAGIFLARRGGSSKDTLAVSLLLTGTMVIKAIGT